MRKFVILALLALVMSLAFPVMAQDAVFCGELEAEDCALLTLVAENGKDLSSGAVDFEVEIDVVNIPNMPSDLNIVLNGNAAYATDPAAVEAFAASAEEGGEAALNALIAFVGGFGSELNLSLSLPEDFAAENSIPFSNLDVELSFVDGIAYINFDTLDAAFGGMFAQQGLTGWYGVNVVELLSTFVAQDPTLIEAFTSGFDGATGGFDPSQLGAVEALAEYINIQRVEDTDGYATFVTSIDFAGVVTNPEFQGLVKEQMETAGQAVTDSEFQQAIAILSIIAQQTTIEVTQLIDEEAGHTVGTVAVVYVDLTSLLAASGQEAAGETYVSLIAGFEYSGWNSTTVTAPDGATVLPTEALLGSMGAN